jgi:gliding motility-associated protein GldM
MGHGKETPRQKMIGMMYLVLMAMLALNVSSDVLNAFSVLDEGLSKTKHSIEQTNSVIINNFKKENEINPKKVKKWYVLAEEVSSKAKGITHFIERCKVDILIAAGEDTTTVIHHGHIDLSHLKGKDKTDAPAIVMVGDADDKAGAELQEKLSEFKEFLLNDIMVTAHEDTKHTIEQGLSTDRAMVHGEEVSWTRARFEHMPQSGVLAILSGIQINIRNAEAEALKYLYAKIDEGTFKFTNLDATVIPNSSYIIKGNEYNAEVFIAARDSTATPVIHVAESAEPYDSIPVEGEEGVWEYKKKPGLEYTTIPANKLTGKAMYRMSGSSIGTKYWGGIVELIGPGGDTIFRPFKKSYMVAEGSVTVAPTKMNVFYVGVDNPVDVSVAGVRPEDVSVTITNGTIKKKKGGSYVVNPRRPGNSFVTVLANIDGKKNAMGKREFRVKRVPDPVAKVAGIKGGGIKKAILIAQVGVAADLENFDFDLTFRVTQFTVSASVQGFRKDAKSKNYKFTNAQKQIIRSLSTGQRLYIEDIKAVGPDGSTRSLPAISLLLN